MREDVRSADLNPLALCGKANIVGVVTQRQKQGEHAIDKDEVYAELAKYFSDEEIIELGLFCAEVDGVGKFVK
jgi:hypothetical protein